MGIQTFLSTPPPPLSLSDQSTKIIPFSDTIYTPSVHICLVIHLFSKWVFKQKILIENRYNLKHINPRKNLQEQLESCKHSRLI